MVRVGVAPDTQCEPGSEMSSSAPVGRTTKQSASDDGSSCSAPAEVTGDDADSNPLAMRHMKTTLFFVSVGAPCAVLIIGAFFGAILAAGEGWTFEEGWFYVVGNVVGLATPLVDVTPDTFWGEILDVYIAALSISVAGVALGFISSFSYMQAATKYLEGLSDNETEACTLVQDTRNDMRLLDKGMQIQMGLLQDQLSQIRFTKWLQITSSLSLHPRISSAVS